MSQTSPVTETLILAILEEELYLGRHHPTDYHPEIMGAKEAAKKIADLSCGAESSRHSGAVGTEKRAEQSNPGGGHEVTEHDAQKLYEQKAAGMIPRPAASPHGVAPTPAERTVHHIEHDGFEGVEIGSYTTLEGRQGVVLQQVGTRVVHVYGRKWLSDTSTDGNCPRCKREPADKALLGSDDEGHICGTCWSNDRHADSPPVREGE